MGTNSVGSMIVFEDGRPRPSHYRHFGIRTVEGSDDFASMEETLRRRFARLLRSRAEGATAEDIPVDDPAGSNGEVTRRRRPTSAAPTTGTSEDSFGVLPDLVLIDGGKGQLGAAHRVLREAGLEPGPRLRPGQAQRGAVRARRVTPDHHREGQPHAVPAAARARRGASLRDHPPPGRRSRSALRSRLDSVPGLGPVRKRTLLRRFGSVDGIRAATVEALSEEVPRAVALSIKELL